MNSRIIAAGILRRMLREKSTLGFILVIPLLISLLFVSLQTQPSGAVAVGVVNYDQGGAGVELLAYLEQTSGQSLKAMPEKRVRDAVAVGDLNLGVVIPADFSAVIRSGQTPQLTVYQFRPSLGAEQFKQRLQSAVADVRVSGRIDAAAPGSGAAVLRAAVADPVGVTTQANRKPSDPFRGRLALGFLLMVMMLYSGSLINGILEDKRNKTFLRAYSAPVREAELVLGTLLAHLTLGVLQIAASLLLMTYVFRVGWETPLSLVFLILTAFLLAVIGLGIGITGFVSDSEKFGVLINLTAAPSCLLAGCFIPLETMPPVLQKAANFLPQKWAIDALVKLQAGAALPDITLHLFILCLFGLVFFTFGVKTLQPGAES